jgi:hypothetical protein
MARQYAGKPPHKALRDAAALSPATDIESLLCNTFSQGGPIGGISRRLIGNVTGSGVGSAILMIIIGCSKPAPAR